MRRKILDITKTKPKKEEEKSDWGFGLDLDGDGRVDDFEAATTFAILEEMEKENASSGDGEESDDGGFGLQSSSSYGDEELMKSPIYWALAIAGFLLVCHAVFQAWQSM